MKMADASEVRQFVEDFSKELAEQNAAVFVGAGLSVGAGYVDWRNFVKPLAGELGLDAELETDLVTLAQYQVNEAGGNRGRVNQILVDEFTRGAKPTRNHELLARLPIPVFWTTNYDRLIEKALLEVGKRPDVKYDVEQLPVTLRGRDAVVYKMHGDVDHPAQAVVTKDDYERYPEDRRQFITALSGDLVSRTFLFLGLSFDDPNLDYVLSRVRVWLGKNMRRHYAVLRRVRRSEFASPGEFRYAHRRQELFVNDLRRFGINVLLIDDYAEVTELLSRLYDRYRRRSVFISGSADDYGSWGKEAAASMLRHLSRELVRHDFRVVSGFGRGIGSAVISGALDAIYASPERAVGDDLVLRPFPQPASGHRPSKKTITRYRQDLVGLAGTAIFVFGNKVGDSGLMDAPGVEEEFDLALAAGLTVLPVGATGFTAQRLWKKVKANFDNYFEKPRGLKRLFNRIGSSNTNADTLVASVLGILERLRDTA